MACSPYYQSNYGQVYYTYSKGNNAHCGICSHCDYSEKSVHACGMAIPIAVLLTSFNVHTTHYNINLYTRFYLVGMGLQAILYCGRDL